jgi:thiamine transport system substrate-binding protein
VVVTRKIRILGLLLALSGGFSLLAIAFGLLNSSHDSLVVLAPSSFYGEYGPGKKLEKMLCEGKENCEIRYLSLQSSQSLVRAIHRQKGHVGADLVVGLDQFGVAQIREFKHAFSDLSGVEVKDLLQEVIDSRFVPYDWGVLTYVCGRSLPDEWPLSALEDSTRSFKLAVQSPEVSSLGVQFFHWLGKAGGEHLIEEFRENPENIVFSSWSDAYGAFTQGQVDAVFSYTTSLYYHDSVEKNYNYKSCFFSEKKHPVQVEYALLANASKNKKLALEFLNLMLSDEGQKALLNSNFMLPVRKEVVAGEFWRKYLPANIETVEIPDKEDVNSLLKEWRRK